MTGDQLPPSYWIKQVRSELAAARQRLCSHGIRPAACNDHKTKPESEGDA